MSLNDPNITLDFTSDVALPEEIGDAEAFFTQLAAMTLRELNIIGYFEISIVITNDKRIREINKTYRGVDNVTDVLSFPLSDAPLIELSQYESWTEHELGDDTHHQPITPEDRPALPAMYRPKHLPPQTFGHSNIAYALGDIMISMPVVNEQARQTQRLPLQELAYLTIHGILHLIGFDDYYEPGYLAMIYYQESIMKKMHIAAKPL